MTLTARSLFASPGGRGAPSDNNRVWEVGEAPWQYASIADAVTSINATPNPPSGGTRATILVYPGQYTSTTPIVIPERVGVKGVQRGTVQLINDTTDLFQVGGQHTFFEDLIIEGSTTSTIYAFDCNNQSNINIRRVDMLGASGAARQRFLKQDGATWSVLCLEDCLVDYRGTGEYACKIFNTSGAARIVDVWVKDCFFDAFGLTSGGGSFELSKLRDIRFWRTTIRGPNNENPPGTKVNTGIRVRNGGSTGITCEVAHCYMCGAERASGGVAVFGDANTLTNIDNSVARGAVAGATIVVNNSFVTA